MGLTASTRREQASAFDWVKKITVFEKERQWERCCVFIGKWLCRAVNRQVWVDVERTMAKKPRVRGTKEKNAYFSILKIFPMSLSTVFLAIVRFWEFSSRESLVLNLPCFSFYGKTKTFHYCFFIFS